MVDVAILGAGELGGSIAHVLARRDLVRSIRMIDDTKQIAAGKALDIMQAGPVEGFSTQVSGTPDLTTAASCAIVVIADRASGGEWRGDDGLQLLRQIAGVGGRRLVVCAGATQRDLVDRGVGEAGFSPAMLFGTAPEALASAVRAIVALTADASVKDVALTLLGAPPSQTVIAWEDASISGVALTSVLDEPTRRHIASTVAGLWPPGPHSLAVAAVEAIAGALSASRRMLSCFVAPSPTQKYARKTIACPVRLSGRGVSVQMPALSANARVALDNAMLK